MFGRIVADVLRLVPCGSIRPEASVRSRAEDIALTFSWATTVAVAPHRS